MSLILGLTIGINPIWEGQDGCSLVWYVAGQPNFILISFHSSDKRAQRPDEQQVNHLDITSAIIFSMYLYSFELTFSLDVNPTCEQGEKFSFVQILFIIIRPKLRVLRTIMDIAVISSGQ